MVRFVLWRRQKQKEKKQKCFATLPFHFLFAKTGVADNRKPRKATGNHGSVHMCAKYEISLAFWVCLVAKIADHDRESCLK